MQRRDDNLVGDATTSAEVNVLQAPLRSGVVVEPYQLEPVARAIEAPRVNLLLSDDVDLGKTIEAGLVALELILGTGPSGSWSSARRA